MMKHKESQIKQGGEERKHRKQRQTLMTLGRRLTIWENWVSLLLDAGRHNKARGEQLGSSVEAADRAQIG